MSCHFMSLKLHLKLYMSHYLSLFCNNVNNKKWF